MAIVICPVVVLLCSPYKAINVDIFRFITRSPTLPEQIRKRYISTRAASTFIDLAQGTSIA